MLFIEKEGFEPLLRAARIAERFDCGLMSTKGMSVIAARTLVDRLSRDGVRILVAHDLDRSGFSIFGTLRGNTRRYRYDAKPEVIDLGLRLETCLAMDLQDEEAPPLPPRTDPAKVARTLREHGATEDEIEFLLHQARRVELNAMTSDQLVAWLEAGLRRHGAGKVVPADGVIELAWRDAVARRVAADAIRAVEQKARAVAATVAPPQNLADAIRDAIEGSDLPWDEALAAIVSRVPLDGQLAERSRRGVTRTATPQHSLSLRHIQASNNSWPRRSPQLQHRAIVDFSGHRERDVATLFRVSFLTLPPVPQDSFWVWPLAALLNDQESTADAQALTVLPGIKPIKPWRTFDLRPGRPRER